RGGDRRRPRNRPRDRLWGVAKGHPGPPTGRARSRPQSVAGSHPGPPTGRARGKARDRARGRVWG
ncbi:hypothetical protein ACWEPC_53120, partial [Nonomuraea sp. NPDC004297]